MKNTHPLIDLLNMFFELFGYRLVKVEEEAERIITLNEAVNLNDAKLIRLALGRGEEPTHVHMIEVCKKGNIKAINYFMTKGLELDNASTNCLFRNYKIDAILKLLDKEQINFKFLNEHSMDVIYESADLKRHPLILKHIQALNPKS